MYLEERGRAGGGWEMGNAGRDWEIRCELRMKDYSRMSTGAFWLRHMSKYNISMPFGFFGIPAISTAALS